MRKASEDYELADRLEELGVPGFSDVWPEAIRRKFQTHQEVRDTMHGLLDSLWPTIDNGAVDWHRVTELDGFSDADWEQLRTTVRLTAALKRYTDECPV